MNNMVDAGAIAGTAAMIVPVVVGVLVKLNAPSWTKAVTAIILTVLNGAASTYAAVGGKATLGQYALTVFFGFVVSGVSYTNLWKPTNVLGTDTNTNLPVGITAWSQNVGIGPKMSLGQGEEQQAA